MGLVVGALTLASVATRPWMGRESDRRGKKQILLWGALGLALSSLSYALAVSVLLLIPLRLFHGVAWAASTTAPSALVADITPPKRRGEAMGYLGTASTLGIAIGPLLGVTLMERYSFNPIFVTASVLGVIAAVTVSLVREPAAVLRSSLTEIEPALKTTSIWASMVYPPAVFPSVVSLIVAIAYGSLVTFVSLLAYRHNVNPGLFFTAYAAALIVVRPLGGRAADLLGRSASIIPGILAQAIGIGLVAFATELPSFLIAAAVFGAGFAFLNPALIALTVDRATPEARGEAMGTFSAAFDLGIGLGAILLGMLLEATNFETLYLMGAGITVFALVFYLIGLRLRL